ncbi:OmpH family outer membrane protein [Pedobacter sp. SYP-B3415]|uniref:OmpH family outer membrane protein n=1 Tax=Pedobacter sp. SYP-B3415 TaxID=2496641 RepID=UPI00101B66D0|nr:OmpH family outer membrane protein [Pedobacter sp. SYP-B3415]
MKKYLLGLFLLVLAHTASAQRFAYVDTEYILGHMPEYKSALNQMETVTKEWQKQVDANFTEIDKMYKAYQADQVLLTDEMRKRRENEIIEKEKQAKEYQRIKFGPEGDLFQLRTKLLKPVQEKVSNMVRTLARTKNLDFVFDKGNDASMIYASSSFDISNEVVTKLGYKPGQRQ